MKWFWRWLYRKVSEVERATYEIQRAEPKERDRLTDMLSGALPAIVAFRIQNGYLVHTTDVQNEAQNHIHVPPHPHQPYQHRFTFCADEREIADHIVTSAVKTKMGLKP